MGWYEDMERAEQERDAQEYECSLAFNEGYNKAIDDFRNEANKYLNESSEFADFVITDTAIDFICDKLKEGALDE